MKTKQEKYEEAVERAIKLMEERWKCGYKVFQPNESQTIELLKHKLGIREDDNQHDALLLNYLAR